MIVKHSISVEKTAQFYSLDELNQHEEILIVLHGYGYSAEEFIQEFSSINSSSRLIIAPEGLNKFYLRGYSGQVGSNWMTKENREDEIKDHIKYLDSIVRKVSSNFSTAPKITLLGFSQGAELASRWSLLGNTKIDKLIIWSGKIARDLDFKAHRKKVNALNIKMIVGNSDSFISEDKLNEERKFLELSEVKFELIRFKGGHIIHQSTLQEVFRTRNSN